MSFVFAALESQIVSLPRLARFVIAPSARTLRCALLPPLFLVAGH